jgi:hypothetical protein
MSVIRGHEDLLPKAIVGFDMGFALVQCGSDVKRYRLTVGPLGGLAAEPVPEDPQGVDQIGASRHARRFHDIDQPIQ